MIKNNRHYITNYPKKITNTNNTKQNYNKSIFNVKDYKYNFFKFTMQSIHNRKYRISYSRREF